jgi:hypothetical protein
MKLSSKDRIQLIHKGNAVYNDGKYILAERLFRAAKYQDGLIRTGQYYFQKKEYLRAADIFRFANYLKGEYACYEKLGLLSEYTDIQNPEEKKKMDEEINKKIAVVVSKMLSAD